MRSTKGLSRIAAESDGEYSDVSDAEHHEEFTSATNKKRKNHVFCILFGFMILGAVACVITLVRVWYDHKASDNMDHDPAWSTMQHLMQFNTSYHNFTANQKLEYAQAFAAFDDDSDQYLNSNEFTNYFQRQLRDMFEQMDADLDGILSYGECVAYLHEMNKIAEVRAHLITTITPQIIREYGLEVELIDANGTLFLEYSAILLYFEEFDVDLNGYVHKNEYLSISARNEFMVIDANDDGKISLDELSNVLYSGSWNAQLFDSFGGRYPTIMRSLRDIKMTHEMVTNITQQLRVSPFEINHMKAKTKSQFQEPRKQHICFQNNHCYYSFFGNGSKDTKHVYYEPAHHERMEPIFIQNKQDIDQLNADEINRINDANRICSERNCCRNDDDNDNVIGCGSYSYLECLSSDNQCIWDCLLPQTNDTNHSIHFRRIFKGISRNNASAILHPQTTKDKEEATMNTVNLDHLSMNVMDSCGTLYEYQLTEASKKREYDNIRYNDPKLHHQESESNDGDQHRRLHDIAKAGEMDENLRRKLAVMGVDGRIDITWFQSPFYKNVYLSFEASDESMRCSGALISPRHVLTAGHCVSDGAGNFYTDFKAFPSYNAGNDGLYYFTGSNVFTFSGWHYYGNYSWDIGIITLNTSSTGFGWFSFGSNDHITSSHWFGVNGYPGDRGTRLQHQWMQMDYDISYHLFRTQSGDIVTGNSGGPAWYYQTQVVYAVVSHETYSSTEPRVYYHNGLARITPEKFRAICAYLSGFAETANHCA